MGRLSGLMKGLKPIYVLKKKIILVLAPAAVLFFVMQIHVVSAEASQREIHTETQLLEALVLQEATTAGNALATYYAPRFIGRRTTSGEAYDPQKLTAAHAELPLGTLVLVENAITGAQVVVRINDRCLRRRFQLIDLSEAAARQIGIFGKGAAMVRMQPYSMKSVLHELIR